MAQKPLKTNRVKDKRGLTAKQRAFCELVNQGTLVRDAVLLAGYNLKKPQEYADKNLLTNTAVIEYMSELREKSSKAKIADANEVLEFLSLMMRGEIIAPKVTKAGVQNLEPDHAVRNDSAKTLAKHHGLLVDRVEQTGSNKLEITFSGNLKDWSE